MNDTELLSNGMPQAQQQLGSAVHMADSDHTRCHTRKWRRRSADVGGLHLATKGLGQGQGWMGGDPLPLEYVHCFHPGP